VRTVEHGDSSGDEVGIELADAIATVRAQLERAIDEGERSAIAFRAGPVELEFEVQFSRKATAGGGVKAWVVSADASGEQSSARTHRVTVTLTPVWRADGTEAQIGSVGAR
jgi:hypothetical protein